MNSPVTPADSLAKVSSPSEKLKPAVPLPASAMRAIVSTFIFVVLACQFVVGFTYHGGQTYPILSYPMFSRVHHDGERLNDYLVYATADGGAEQVFDPERMVLSFPLYQKMIAGPLIRGETPDATKNLAATVCNKQGAKVVTLNVYDSGYHISRTGPVGVGKKLMGSAKFVCDDM